MAELQPEGVASSQAVDKTHALAFLLLIMSATSRFRAILGSGSIGLHARSRLAQ